MSWAKNRASVIASESVRRIVVLSIRVLQVQYCLYRTIGTRPATGTMLRQDESQSSGDEQSTKLDSCLESRATAHKIWRTISCMGSVMLGKGVNDGQLQVVERYLLMGLSTQDGRVRDGELRLSGSQV